MSADAEAAPTLVSVTKQMYPSLEDGMGSCRLLDYNQPELLLGRHGPYRDHCVGAGRRSNRRARRPCIYKRHLTKILAQLQHACRIGGQFINQAGVKFVLANEASLTQVDQKSLP